MSIQEKIENIQKNWSFIKIWDSSQEFLLSNNGKYLFYCKIQLGSFEADCNLNGR